MRYKVYNTTDGFPVRIGSYRTLSQAHAACAAFRAGFAAQGYYRTVSGHTVPLSAISLMIRR